MGGTWEKGIWVKVRENERRDTMGRGGEGYRKKGCVPLSYKDEAEVKER